MLQDVTQMLWMELEPLDSDEPSVWANTTPEQVRATNPISPNQRNDMLKLRPMMIQRGGLPVCAMGCSAAAAKLTNALAPVNKLPPEVLGMIPAYQESQIPKDLVTVSSVCSYWRNTFLATPSLWTRLDGKGIEKTRLWIKRSRTLPTQLQVEGSPSPDVLKYLGAHSSRLEVVDLPELNLQDRPLFTHGYISNILRPTPLLRHVCVETEAGNPETFGAPIIIAGKFPSLEVLRLSGVPVSIPQLSAPKLRQLCLTGKFDLVKILDLLDSFPLLECLAFRLGLQEDIPVGSGRKVVLGKLLQASFFYHGFRILQHLSLPVVSDVKLIEDIPIDRLDGAVTNDYTQFLARVLDDLPMSRQIDTISFYTKGSCRILLLSGPNGEMELVTHRIDNPAACIVLLRLFTRHSIESLQNLSISNLYVPPSDTDIISDFLKPLTGLQSLMMQQSFASQCLLALGTNYCLQLQNLEIQRPSPWLTEYNGLVTFVQDRSEAGIPIQRLLVSNSFPAPLDAGDMKTLVKYVKYVAWR